MTLWCFLLHLLALLGMCWDAMPPSHRSAPVSPTVREQDLALKCQSCWRHALLSESNANARYRNSAIFMSLLTIGFDTVFYSRALCYIAMTDLVVVYYRLVWEQSLARTEKVVIPSRKMQYYSLVSVISLYGLLTQCTPGCVCLLYYTTQRHCTSCA